VAADRGGFGRPQDALRIAADIAVATSNGPNTRSNVMRLSNNQKKHLFVIQL
jgi:hypothetical protein